MSILLVDSGYRFYLVNENFLNGSSGLVILCFLQRPTLLFVILFFSHRKPHNSNRVLLTTLFKKEKRC